jgi:hypothetical protein
LLRAAQKDDNTVQSQTQMMQALLLGVRQLRQAVERMAALNGRGQAVQIALQQMQVHEQRLNHASVQLEGIRREIEAVSSQRLAHASLLQNAEARLSEEQDATRLPQLQRGQGHIKAMIEQSEAKEARLRSQEADAVTLVQNEQNKWQDLSDRVSSLTESLESDSVVPPSTSSRTR